MDTSNRHMRHVPSGASSNCTESGVRRVNDGVVDPWLVLRTRSRHESTVEGILRQKRVRSYLPRHKLVRRWKQTRRVVELPLFPGYVFVQPTIEQYEGMRYIRGTCGFVLAGGKPATMSEDDLRTVQKLVDSGVELMIEEELVPGKRVRIDAGPFAGIEGELVRIRNRDLLVINVHLVSSSVRVEVSRESIAVL